jgi:hypothetical protein
VDFSEKLLELLAIIEKAISMTRPAADLIERVVAGPLIDAAQLASPSDEERKTPS